jgi:hypothetical protein
VFHRILLSFGFAALLPLSAVAADGVKITEQPDKLRIEIHGELFTEYCFKGAPHVYFFPLHSAPFVPSSTRFKAWAT